MALLVNWQRVILTPPSDTRLRLYNNMIYHGDSARPQVGDVRVSFEFAGSTRQGQEDKVCGVCVCVCVCVCAVTRVLCRSAWWVDKARVMWYLRTHLVSIPPTPFSTYTWGHWVWRYTRVHVSLCVHCNCTLIVGSQELFASEHSSNNVVTWALRGLGMFLVFIGFNMITGILVTLGECVLSSYIHHRSFYS